MWESYERKSQKKYGVGPRCFYPSFVIPAPQTESQSHGPLMQGPRSLTRGNEHPPLLWVDLSMGQLSWVRDA